MMLSGPGDTVVRNGLPPLHAIVARRFCQCVSLCVGGWCMGVRERANLRESGSAV